MAMLSLLLTAAIFGFFYAWVCSTMWGLDSTTPATAIRAMQAMNASVRNVIFAPAFFGTAPALLVTALLAWRDGAQQVACAFGTAGLIYLLGGTVLTVMISVPMNEALAQVDPGAPNAGDIWAVYSKKWQFWNQMRTLASGAALLLAGLGLYWCRG